MKPTTQTLQVFDPAMCCPTGLCGPQVDPVLGGFGVLSSGKSGGESSSGSSGCGPGCGCH